MVWASHAASPASLVASISQPQYNTFAVLMDRRVKCRSCVGERNVYPAREAVSRLISPMPPPLARGFPELQIKASPFTASLSVLHTISILDILSTPSNLSQFLLAPRASSVSSRALFLSSVTPASHDQPPALALNQTLERKSCAFPSHILIRPNETALSVPDGSRIPSIPKYSWRWRVELRSDNLTTCR